MRKVWLRREQRHKKKKASSSDAAASSYICTKALTQQPKPHPASQKSTNRMDQKKKTGNSNTVSLMME